MCVSSSNGPDWKDIHTTMRDLETTYRVAVSMMVTPGGKGEGWMLLVALLATWVDLGQPGGVGSAAVSAPFPHSSHKTLEGTVYELGYKLERMLMTSRLQQVEWI